MTAREAIAAFDRLYPNDAGDVDKILWLSDLDGRIFLDVILEHEHEEGLTFEPYTPDSLDRVLLAPDPHSSIYPIWLRAQYEYHTRMDVDRYNVHITAFNSDFAEFKSWYTRTHRGNPVAFKMGGHWPHA
jgi:hypothetical protein